MFEDPLTLHAIKGVHRIVTDYMGKDNVPDLDGFADIYGRMAINGFEICDEMGNNRLVKNNFFIINFQIYILNLKKVI